MVHLCSFLFNTTETTTDHICTVQCASTVQNLLGRSIVRSKGVQLYSVFLFTPCLYLEDLVTRVECITLLAALG